MEVIIVNALNRLVVKNVVNAVTVFSPKGRCEKMKDRIWYGISFCLEGQITYIQNGKKYVSDKNHAVILPKGQSYEIYGDKKGYFPVINFTIEGFLCDEITIIPISDVQSYIKDFEIIKNLVLFEKNRMRVMSIFYSILYKLFCDSEPQNEVLINAVKYIEKNYHIPELTNDTLARECNISEVYLRKLFSKQFGTTPKQYIIDVRIDKAKQHLTEGMYKINAVSEKSGFSNPYHFSRAFKEKTGLTPTEYMKKNRIFKI